MSHHIFITLFIILLYLFATHIFFNQNLHKKTQANKYPALFIMLQIIITILCPMSISLALYK